MPFDMKGFADDSKYKDLFKEIRSAHLPDAQTILKSEVKFSFVEMLQNYAQQVMTGQLTSKQYYQALDNMENAIHFFRSVTMVGDNK